MKALLMAVAVAVITAVAIAALAPATLVDARVAAVSDGAVRLADAGGTVWRGSGFLGASDGRWRVPVAWTLDLAPLMRGEAVVALGSAEASDVRGRASLSRDHVVIDSLDAALPGTMLGALDPTATLATGGEVKVRATSLNVVPGSDGGTLVADWVNARAHVGTLRIDLGTVTLRLAARSGALAGPLANMGGDVGVDGNLTLRDQRVDAQLRLTPRAAASPELRNALASLGAADAQGAVTLRIARTLR